MYIFIFYGLILSIVISLFFKFNPSVLETLKDNFEKEQKEEIVYIEEIEEIEKPIHYNYKERIERWNFYLNQNFLELAATEYSAALLEEKTIEAYKRLYQTQKTLWDYDKAEKNLLSAFKMKKDDSLTLDLVKIKIHKDEFKSAQDLLKTIKTNSLEKDYINFILSILKLDKNKIEKDIVVLLNKAKSKGDKNIEMKLMVVKTALDEFSTYKDWKDEHLFLLIAKALSNGYQFEISSQVSKLIIQKRPDYRDWWILMGYNKMRVWDIESALNSMKKAYELDPTNSDTQFYLAVIYEDLWKKELSQKFYENALKNWYKPKSQIYQKLAQVYYENENYKSSVEMYKNMLSKNSKNVDYFILPFDISVSKLKDYKLWFKIAEWAVRRHPKEAISYSILWYWYLLNWDLVKAKENIQNSLKIDPELARSYLYAWMVSEKKWDTFTAMKQYEMAQKKDKKWKVGLEAIKKYNNLIN